MEPAILRTCRRIYAEAAPRLYAMNVFAINAPDQLVSLFDQVDLAHFHLIRSLDIFVPCWTPVEPWIPMFSLLSQHAAGLRSIVIKWNSDIDYVQKHERGCRGSGLGDDVSFVRALASVRGLDKLVIKGFFATHWPAYLSASIGIQVQDLPGNCYEPPENATSWICEIADNINEQGLLDFVEYQKGTEGLWP
jgi:hypothetical protein